jgi:glyoxylase-like metal-dependent hydrolase (beta-lactamase superfamily II)
MIQVIDLHFLGETQSIASFLLTTSQNQYILVESGPHSSLKNLQKELAILGVDWKKIQHVFLTHIHLDHAGAAWAFAENGAKIYVHPAGLSHLANPEKLMNSAKMIYQEKMDFLWGQMKPISQELLVRVENEATFTIDDITLKAWHTPGHAIHHIAWQVDNHIFTGDVGGVKIGNGPVVAPMPPPDIDLEAWENSIRLLKSLNAENFYLTHFGKVSGDLSIHLDHLQNNMKSLAEWVLAEWQKGKTIEEITPAFDEYCQQELLKQNIDNQTLTRYQYANPAWMSVAGLVRYWKKKLGTK